MVSDLYLFIVHFFFHAVGKNLVCVFARGDLVLNGAGLFDHVVEVVYRLGAVVLFHADEDHLLADWLGHPDATGAVIDLYLDPNCLDLCVADHSSCLVLSCRRYFFGYLLFLFVVDTAVAEGSFYRCHLGEACEICSVLKTLLLEDHDATCDFLHQSIGCCYGNVGLTWTSAVDHEDWTWTFTEGHDYYAAATLDHRVVLL